LAEAFASSLSQARNPADGKAMSGIIFKVDEGDDPFEEQSWIKANPNYGDSIYPENFPFAGIPRPDQALDANVIPYRPS
jgi:hypothetical protein